MTIDFHHYCWKDHLYFECTNPDPEMKRAKCPKCGGHLILGPCSLELTKSLLALAKSEIGTGTVTYTPIKKDEL